MAAAGFDWLAVDAEHSPVGITEIANMFRAIESRGATPIVRVWDHAPETIGRVLDAGAFGVVFRRMSAHRSRRRKSHKPAATRHAGDGLRDPVERRHGEPITGHGLMMRWW